MISARIHHGAQFQSTTRSPDGKVDAGFLSPSTPGKSEVTDIRDPRIDSVLSNHGSKDFGAMGAGWEGSYADLPRWGSRGMEALDRWTTFKSSDQQLEINWETRTVTLDSNGPEEKTGHRVQAGFDYQSRLKPDTITEFTYLLA